MRLIDADELEKRFNEECCGDCGLCDHEAFNKGVYSCKLIKDSPTVDCENCDFRKFTETFVDGVVAVMNKNGITSLEQLSEILKGGADMMETAESVKDTSQDT